MTKKIRKKKTSNIDMVVEKIINGQRNFSDEDLQIYVNHSRYIEQRLCELQRKEESDVK